MPVTLPLGPTAWQGRRSWCPCRSRHPERARPAAPRQRPESHRRWRKARCRAPAGTQPSARRPARSSIRSSLRWRSFTSIPFGKRLMIFLRRQEALHVADRASARHRKIEGRRSCPAPRRSPFCTRYRHRQRLHDRLCGGASARTGYRHYFLAGDRPARHPLRGRCLQRCMNVRYRIQALHGYTLRSAKSSRPPAHSRI